MTSITFARGGGKAPAKGGGKSGGVIADVVNAISGVTDNCGNGTVSGKKGFQPGNKCHGNRNAAVSAAQKAHTAANSVTRKHVKAGTLNTPAGRAAIKAGAKAHRELQAARATHKAAQKVARAEKRRTTRAAAKVAAATPRAQATATLKAAHAATKPAPRTEAPGKSPARSHAESNDHELVAARILEEAPRIAPAGSRVRLADLREAMPDVPKQVFDRAAMHLAEKGTASLFRLDNPGEITSRDRSSVFKTPSGEERHIGYFGGRSSSGDPAEPGRLAAKLAEHRRSATKPEVSRPKQVEAAAKGDLAAREEYLADAARRKAAFEAAYKRGNVGLQKFPEINDKAAAKSRVKADVAKASDEAKAIKAKAAAGHIKDIHAGAASGRHDEAAAAKHIDKLAKGHTKDELFAAAKQAGIEHSATTKKALVEHLKAHAVPKAAASPAADKLPIKEFAARVVKAAQETPAGGVGKEKTFISHVKAHLEETDPAFRGMTDAAFKARLLEADHARHLELGRGDLIEAFDPADVRASKTPFLTTEYHFVRHPEAPGKVQSHSEQAKRMHEQAKRDAGPGVVTPHDFKETLRKVHGGEIDDRRTTVDQVARKSGLPHDQVEATVRELGARGALSFDHATPREVANAKGVQAFPTDHEGRPYHGFRVDRPAKFEAATASRADTAPARSFTDVSKPRPDYDARREANQAIYKSEAPLHQGYIKSLPKPELDALKRYKNGADDRGVDAYQAVNGALRAGKSHPLVAKLDAAIGRGSVPHDTVVYRGIEDLSHYGFGSPHEAVGSVLHDKAFVSTTLSHHTAHTFAGGEFGENNAIVRVRLPKGTTAAYTDPVNNMGENEYVLPRGSSFRITGHGGKTADGVHILDAELHHHGHVGFAAEPEPEPEPGRPDGREGRFSWKPGDITVTRPGEKEARP